MVDTAQVSDELMRKRTEEVHLDKQYMAAKAAYAKGWPRSSSLESTGLIGID